MDAADYRETGHQHSTVRERNDTVDKMYGQTWQCQCIERLGPSENNKYAAAYISCRVRTLNSSPPSADVYSVFVKYSLYLKSIYVQIRVFRDVFYNPEESLYKL
jgi:hypothetical protein